MKNQNGTIVTRPVTHQTAHKLIMGRRRSQPGEERRGLWVGKMTHESSTNVTTVCVSAFDPLPLVHQSLQPKCHQHLQFGITHFATYYLSDQGEVLYPHLGLSTLVFEMRILTMSASQHGCEDWDVCSAPKTPRTSPALDKWR